MKQFPRKRYAVSGLMIQATFIALILRAPLRAEDAPLQAMVTPSTIILKDGRPVTFAVHGFIEFKSLAELFPYIESQTQRWKGRAALRMRSGSGWCGTCCAAESRVALSRWQTNVRSRRW